MQNYYEIKASELVKTFESKGIHIENGRNKYDQRTIGVKGTSGNVWYWFTVGASDQIYFCHSYSCNTGKASRSFKSSFTAYNTIGKLYNK